MVHDIWSPKKRFTMKLMKMLIVKQKWDETDENTVNKQRLDVTDENFDDRTRSGMKVMKLLAVKARSGIKLIKML